VNKKVLDAVERKHRPPRGWPDLPARFCVYTSEARPVLFSERRRFRLGALFRTPGAAAQCERARERKKRASIIHYGGPARPGPARRGPATPVACAGLRRVGARPRCAMNINDRAPTTTAVDNSARPPPPPPPGVLLRQCRMISKFRADGCVVLPATERSLARGAALCRYKVHDSPSSSSTQMTFFGGFDRSESAGRQSCD